MAGPIVEERRGEGLRTELEVSRAGFPMREARHRADTEELIGLCVECVVCGPELVVALARLQDLSACRRELLLQVGDRLPLCPWYLLRHGNVSSFIKNARAIRK